VLPHAGYDPLCNRHDGLTPEPNGRSAGTTLFKRVSNEGVVDAESLHQPSRAISRSHVPLPRMTAASR
jgi:hypothetical protein